MSLRVWLPLTKDLRNQGLDDVTVTNNGATFNSAGKLGGCYYFNGDKQWLQFSSVLGEYYNNDWSIACWLKPTDSTRSVIISEYNTSGASNVGLELTTSRVVRLYWNGSPDINFTTAGALPLNEWTHLTVTKAGRVVKVYFNGELKQTYINSSDFSTRTSAARPRIGDDYRGNSANTVSYQGYINDFRMYDHCLSPMEVKELAKGLVLHYPLSSGNLIDINNITDGAYLNSNGGITGTNGWCYTDYIPVYSNSQYICTGLSKGGSGTYIVLYDNTKTKTRTLLLTANQNLDITTSDIEKYIRLSIRELANELTTTARFVYMSTTEYDCSGFCNNGTKNGTYSYTSDTPKYAVSQNCLGTNYISLTPPSTEVQTIAVWVNWKAIPSGQSVIFVDYGSGMGLGLMNTGILCSTSGAGSSYTFSKANLVANTWYHFVIVKTGTTTRKLYINGVEQTATSNTSNWSYSVNQLQLGKRSTTSDGFVGKLSDFRAYATALSADDVQSLYQNSAYIDSSGNVYGAVHTEV